DPFLRIVKVEKQNPQGITIACTDKVYDPNGNMTHWKEHVYDNGQHQNTQCMHYIYTTDNKIASSIRAFETTDSRTTSYTYTAGNKVSTKTLPDGIVLSYSYDPLGFLKTLRSSDGKIRHRFDCTKTGELTSAWDEVENITVHRKLDPFGNVVQELFSTGIEVKKSHDRFDRLLSLQITDVGSIFYNYDPLHLKSVSRYTPDGKNQYTHQYESYDLDGNLLIENMIFKAGNIKHSVDLKGRKTDISSPYFTQKCAY